MVSLVAEHARFPHIETKSRQKHNQSVRSLITPGVSRDLYVQALAAFQEVDESDELSYFGIMGECLSS